jgi:hypothetical protein
MDRIESDKTAPPEDREADAPGLDAVLAPVAEFPRIDLRAGVEAWDKRRKAGKRRRAEVPHARQAALDPDPDRPDPVALIEAAHAGRQPHLIPLRVARMASSPFAFLRGAAHVMAWDLSRGPRSGIDVVMNGDAHTDNFGLFGTPQRDIVLDLNDFDEVTIGPWEWDLKRLAAGLAVATADAGAPASERRAAVTEAVSGYQHTMRRLAPQGSLDVWYQTTRADAPHIAGLQMDAEGPGRGAAGGRQGAAAEQPQPAGPGGRAAHRRQLAPADRSADPDARGRGDPRGRRHRPGALRYAETLPRERRFMLDRYHVVDVAHPRRRRRQCRGPGPTSRCCSAIPTPTRSSSRSRRRSGRHTRPTCRACRRRSPGTGASG